MGEPKNGELINTRRKEESQAEVDIWKYVFGFTGMAVVKCAIELGIADVLESHEGPMTLYELSSALGCSSDAVYRIMRFLIHCKIFKEIQTGMESVGYVQTPASRFLMKNSNCSMADLVLLESSPVMLVPWLGLSARTLEKGAPPFQAANQEDLWNYTEANPAHSKLFNDAMSCHAKIAVSAIISNHPGTFKGIQSVVDVGGGDGTALRMLVKAFPWIQGINFDLLHVVSAAPLCDGVEHVAGNMFDGIPKADVAFIMLVLHDWGDDECIEILKKCREAIPKDTGKVMIIEAVVDGVEGDKYRGVHLALDMVMMAHTDNGKERTAKEWEYVLNSAGFSRYTFKRIQTDQSVIEAYP